MQTIAWCASPNKLFCLPKRSENGRLHCYFLQKLKAYEPQKHIEAKKQALQKHPEMQELTMALISKMHECDAWGLINICWAQGAMSLGSTKLMRKVCDHACCHHQGH